MRTDTDSSSPQRDLAARRAGFVDACWPLVRVESVQVAPTDAGERARALVQLGRLTPADVRVELFAAGAADATPTAQHGELRMFSTQSYDNGAFVFEAILPPGDAARPREWRIHVHPSEASEEPRVQCHFRSGRP